MASLIKRGWIVGVGFGLLVGLLVGGFWPRTPLHAVGAANSEGYAMATGFVDEANEAIYFLDFLTGTLRAKVLSSQSQGFQAHYEANVNRDLMGVIQFRNGSLAQTNVARRREGLPPLPELEMPQAPNYLMVTGSLDVRRGAAARLRPAKSAVYVAETNTGIVLCYLIAWDQGSHSTDQPAGGPLTLWAGDQFTSVVVQNP